MKKDEVLTLKNEQNEFIPLQQVFHNKVTLTTNELPNKSGVYPLVKNNESIATLAYNYDRAESKIANPNLSELLKEAQNITISNSIKDTFTKLNQQQQIKPLFKWFLGLAILFLLLEIGILKFFKV